MLVTMYAKALGRFVSAKDGRIASFEPGGWFFLPNGPKPFVFSFSDLDGLGGIPALIAGSGRQKKKRGTGGFVELFVLLS